MYIYIYTYTYIHKADHVLLLEGPEAPRGVAEELLGGTQTGSYQTGSYHKGCFIPPKLKSLH